MYVNTDTQKVLAEGKSEACMLFFVLLANADIVVLVPFASSNNTCT